MANQGVPRNPFKDEDRMDWDAISHIHYELQAEVEELTQKYDKLPIDIQNMQGASVLSWAVKFKESFQELSKLEAKLHERRKGLVNAIEHCQSVGEKAKSMADEIHQNTEKRKERSDKVAITRQEKIKNVVRTLQKVASSKEQLLNWIDVAYSEDEEMSITVDHEKIPQELIAAMSTNFELLEEPIEWSVEVACEIIQDVGQKLKAAAVKEPRFTIEPQIHSSMRSRTRSKSPSFLSEDEKYVNQGLETVDNPSQSPEMSMHEGNADEDEQELENMSHDLVILQTENDSLKYELGIANAAITKSKKEKIRMQTLLLHHSIHHCALTNEQVDNIASELEERLFIDDNVQLGLSVANPILLGDELVGYAQKPVAGSTFAYLVMLSDDMKRTDDREIKDLVEQQILWVGTVINRILKSTTQMREEALLLTWIKSVVQDLELSGIGRVALFLLVADICQRSTTSQTNELWHSTINAVINGRYGSAYKDWDVLTRICFTRLIAVGSSRLSLDSLVNETQRKEMYSLIDSQVNSCPSDIIAFLRQKEIVGFIKAENSGSETWSIATSSEEQLACVRTGDGSEPFHFREYLWVRHSGKVYFAQDGFKIRIESDKNGNGILQIQVKGTDVWFEVAESEVNKYLTSYYSEALLQAVDKWLPNLPGSTRSKDISQSAADPDLGTVNEFDLWDILL